LATVGVASQFRFGGVIDLAALQPTAGREALDDRSNELLRRLVAAVDEIAAEIAVHHPDSLDNIPVLSWIVRHGKYELAESLRVRTEPEGKQMRLADLRAMTQSVIWYGGTDSQVIRSYGSEEKPLIVISRQGPRRDCEIGYLRSISATEIADRPHVLERLDAGSLSTAHGAVLFRMARVLVEDYFVDSQVRFARMSHGIPVLVDRSETPPVVYLDPDSPSIAALATWYDSDFVTFGALVKDYVRSHVFPKLSDLVPSSTREGADAFLRRLRAKQELFEIDWTDRDDLASIWSQYALGEINLTEAAIRSRAVSLRSVVEIRPSQAGSISAVVPALEEPSTEAVEPGSDPYGPLPPIDRREISTEALVLTGEIPINGYRCFVALSERAQQQHAEFFYQPHTTSVVWGGQKIMFVFLHHSGRFGLYYDVQCPGLVAKASGGGTQQTSTILLSNHVFIPVPDEVADNFVPKQGERLRFEIRCDVLPVEIAQDDLQLADGKVSAA
jgi:molecular chaperone HtpG